MSRIGKYPVDVPAGVTVSVNNGRITAKGKLGETGFDFPDAVTVSVDGSKIWVKPVHETAFSNRMWGTVRAKVNNLVIGVSKGFSKKLELVGVGFKAAISGKDLKMSLGFSHEVLYTVPASIKIVCPQPTQIEVSGIDKKDVGQVSAEIRAFRPPEPYKGKGIKYEGEFILRKVGKKK